MELTIQIVSGAGERIAVHVPTGAETTVLELKQLIELQNSVRFPVAAQRLIFQGQILQNEKLLGEYNITTGMALHLTLAPGVAASIAAAAAAAPAGPSTVRAAFASLPPSTRAPTPATRMRQYLQQMQSDAGFDVTIQTLKKICENIVGHPTEDKYRKLRLGNAALKARLFDKSRGLDCVRLLGFQDGIEEGHVVLVPNAERWETMMTLKRVIDEFASMPPPSAMFGGAATSTSAGGGLPGVSARGQNMGGGDFANMAAQASAMLQNPMMAQTLSNHPMMQQMAQANPMIAQALQNPALLQQMMQSMQQNPAMMQQVSQMMQSPNAMQQMQQMMSGGGMGGGGVGMGMPTFPSAPSAPSTSTTQANPFAPPAAGAAVNPFASFAVPPSSAPAPAAPAPTAHPAAAVSTAPTAPTTASSGEEVFDEDDIAAAIARSLEEH